MMTLAQRSLFLLGLTVLSCGGPTRDTTSDHLVDLSRVSQQELKESRKALDETGCVTLLDFRMFVSDLRRKPDETKQNDDGNRYCVWKLSGGVQVTVVDDSSGLVDSANVLFNTADTVTGATGLALVNLLADAFSARDVKSDDLLRWVIKHHMEEGAHRGFGGAYLRILGFHRSGGKQYTLVRVS